jgi:hypothetical protein
MVHYRLGVERIEHDGCYITKKGPNIVSYGQPCCLNGTIMVVT